MNSLLVAKFIPGVNSVTAPLAGSAQSPYWRFVLYDAVGVCIWSGSYLATGYVFSEQLEILFGYGARMGSGLFLLVIGLLASWIAWKLIQRRRFLRKLAMARITPEELRDRLDAGEEFFMVDLRAYLPAHSVIPGAIRMAPEDLAAHGADLPRDREIILFCSWPNEATSARVALLLKAQGITRVRPVRGGVEAWERLKAVRANGE